MTSQDNLELIYFINHGTNISNDDNFDQTPQPQNIGDDNVEDVEQKNKKGNYLY